MTPTITITTPTLNKSIATSRRVGEGVKQGKTQSQRVESVNVGKVGVCQCFPRFLANRV